MMKNERKKTSLVLVEFLQLVWCLEDSVRVNLFVFGSYFRTLAVILFQIYFYSMIPTSAPDFILQSIGGQEKGDRIHDFLST